MIKVVNVTKTICTHYCGRFASLIFLKNKDEVKNCSALGNPFPINEPFYPREEVIEKYKGYFKNQMKTNLKFVQAINQIKEDAKFSDVLLGCFCSPLACHCDIIKEYVEKDGLKKC